MFLLRRLKARRPRRDKPRQKSHDMMNKVLLAIASTLEAVTGIGLIIAPSMVRFLLGPDVSSASLAIARIAGFGLLSLGIACWPRVERSIPRLSAMPIYNLLATVYLGYLRFSSESVGKLCCRPLQSTPSWHFCLSESGLNI
jgi:hypothetical protein